MSHIPCFLSVAPVLLASPLPPPIAHLPYFPLLCPQESGPHPLAKARVSLSSRELHVYEASLAITPQLNWLQHVMFHWFYTTALLAVLFLATVQATALGLAYLWAQVRQA